MNIYDYVNERQVKEIVNTIIECCNNYNQCKEMEDKLFYEPYCKKRRKHALTSAVISGFSPSRLKVSGFTVTDVKYGLDMTQPELCSENAIIHIYSNGSDLKNNIIKKRCQMYNLDMNKPIFLIVQFHANDKGILNKIEFRYLDSNANKKERIEVYHNEVKNIRIA